MDWFTLAADGFPIVVTLVSVALTLGKSISAASELRSARSAERRARFTWGDRLDPSTTRSLLFRLEADGGLAGIPSAEVAGALNDLAAEQAEQSANPLEESSVEAPSGQTIEAQPAPVQPLEPLTAETVARIVATALADQSKSDREQAERVRKAERKFQIWLAVASFVAGLAAGIAWGFVSHALGLSA